MIRYLQKLWVVEVAAYVNKSKMAKIARRAEQPPPIGHT